MPFDLGLSADLLVILALVAFAAGFVDAIAGGGGLITVPALLLAGLPPVEAIATNKLQGTLGVASSTFTFWRAGRVEPDLVLRLGGVACLGGMTGAALAHWAPTELLRALIPPLLIAIALFVLASPKLGDTDAKPRMALPLFVGAVGFPIAAYDGAFGPGGGTFYLLGLILLCGFPLMRGIAHARLMNLGSNFGALAIFLPAGDVRIAIGILMGLSAALGANLGARTTLRFGGHLVRPMIVGVSLLMALRLLIDPQNPLGQWLRALVAKFS